jgi:hypothetical protein
MEDAVLISGRIEHTRLIQAVDVSGSSDAELKVLDVLFCQIGAEKVEK